MKTKNIDVSSPIAVVGRQDRDHVRVLNAGPRELFVALVGADGQAKATAGLHADPVTAYRLGQVVYTAAAGSTNVPQTLGRLMSRARVQRLIARV